MKPPIRSEVGGKKSLSSDPKAAIYSGNLDSEPAVVGKRVAGKQRIV